MRNLIEHLTTVDIQQIINVGAKLIKIYEGVFCRGNFKVSPFREALDKLFASRQNYKDGNNNFMQLLVKLLMNSF